MFPITRILRLAAAGALVALTAACSPAHADDLAQNPGPVRHTSPFSLSKTPERLANAICIDGRYLATLAKLVYGAGCISTLPRTSDETRSAKEHCTESAHQNCNAPVTSLALFLIPPGTKRGIRSNALPRVFIVFSAG